MDSATRMMAIGQKLQQTPLLPSSQSRVVSRVVSAQPSRYCLPGFVIDGRNE